MRPSSILLAFAMSAAAVHAQLVPDNPDWREAQAPPPPAVKIDGLIPLDIPGSNLRFGVEPASVSLGGDGIVRYVVVATSTTGAVNAIYEGIRCGSGEFRIYARHNPDSGWTVLKEATWRSLHEQPISRHSLLIARTGACIGRGPNRSGAQVVQDLRAPADNRFQY